MGRNHTHGGQPCRFGTLKTCGQHWREFQHGHHGQRCRKGMVPSSSKKGEMVETCVLISLPEHGMSFAGLVAACDPPITATCCAEIVLAR